MKDRSMATGPYPVRARKSPVVLETWCAGPIQRTVGVHAIITLSDGSEVACCNTPHGHRTNATFTACATRRVAQLNDAAGIPVGVR